MGENNAKVILGDDRVSSLMSDLLMSNLLQSQVQLLRNTQTNVHNSGEVLKGYIKVDKGVMQAKEQEQLNHVQNQESTAGTYLTKTMNKQKDMISKTAKDKVDQVATGSTVIGSKDAAVLNNQRQKLLSEITRLQSSNDDTDSQQVDKLQQQLQAVESALQESQASPSGGSGQESVSPGPAYTVELNSSYSPAPASPAAGSADGGQK
jgi:hypothetical protein